MSADLIAYGQCDWCPQITVVNPDGTREQKTLHFQPKEGAKIYLDMSLYGDSDGGVAEPYGGLESYIAQDRLEELWDN